MNRRSFLTTTAATAVIAATSLPALAQEPLKVGFIYVGPVGDMGWSFQHDLGRGQSAKVWHVKVHQDHVGV